MAELRVRRGTVVASDDKHVPDTYEGPLEPNYYCRAWNGKREKYCRSRAGKRTDHVGVGRCWLHGGGAEVTTKHGRYSRIKREGLGDLIAEYEADPDPLNVLPELAACRALFQDYIERYDEWREALFRWYESWLEDGEGKGKPRQMLDISDAYRLLSEVTKMVKRVEDTRAQNAISRPDLFRLMQEMGRIVARHVDDEDQVQRIHDEWNSIRLA